MNRRPLPSRRLLLALGLVALAGCDDDEPITAISTEQAEALTVAVWEQAYLVGAGVPLGFGAVGTPPIAAQSSEYQAETTESCDLAGTVTLETTGFLVEDPDGEGGTISIVGVQTHAGCTFEAEGITFTLDGAPSVTTAWEFMGDGQGNIAFDGSMTGGVDVTSGTASGFCGFDVDWTGASTAQGSLTFELEGTVCGRAVSRSLSVAPTT